MKDQGACVSSAAFATVAAVEACYHRTTKTSTILSEQQLIDCAYRFQVRGQQQRIKKKKNCKGWLKSLSNFSKFN